MKLELKRVKEQGVGSFALYVDGVCVPAQAKTKMVSTPDDITRVIVEFHSIAGDDNTIQIIGD